MKKIICMVMVLMIASLIPLVNAQLTLGEPAQHKLITITITDQGDVHVIHEINKPRSVVDVKTIEGTVSNLNVTDVEGNNVS